MSVNYIIKAILKKFCSPKKVKKSCYQFLSKNSYANWLIKKTCGKSATKKELSLPTNRKEEVRSYFQQKTILSLAHIDLVINYLEQMQLLDLDFAIMENIGKSIAHIDEKFQMRFFSADQVNLQLSANQEFLPDHISLLAPYGANFWTKKISFERFNPNLEM